MTQKTLPYEKKRGHIEVYSRPITILSIFYKREVQNILQASLLINFRRLQVTERSTATISGIKSCKVVYINLSEKEQNS